MSDMKVRWEDRHHAHVLCVKPSQTIHLNTSYLQQKAHFTTNPSTRFKQTAFVCWGLRGLCWWSWCWYGRGEACPALAGLGARFWPPQSLSLTWGPHSLGLEEEEEEVREGLGSGSGEEHKDRDWNTRINNIGSIFIQKTYWISGEYYHLYSLDTFGQILLRILTV